jgi:hypothetical protein
MEAFRVAEAAIEAAGGERAPEPAGAGSPSADGGG